MSNKNLWERDRESLFRELTSDYLNEGYSKKEAKRLAKQETNEIMTDGLDFIDDVVKKTYDGR
jgi:hypothetical protein|tara:strand:+ start:1337 stop:1525 length:189 start_codon:yes stop_codon:yes gene_type:complete